MPNKALARLKEFVIEAKKQGFSLHKRLFAIFLLLILTLMLSILVILNLSGVFSVGLKEQKTVLDSELSYLTSNIYKDYGEISVKSVSLSQSLSLLIENYLNANNIPAEKLSEHPEEVNNLLSEVFSTMEISLEKVKSSGVFIILDTTINPSLDNADYSRAGLFIKNMEPNIVNASSPYTVVLRGPASLARANNLSLHSQWALEFDVTDAEYYYGPILSANNNDLPLSRQYYWSNAIRLPGVSETGMLCSVPLISSSGTVFGVCGFEVSNMLFKLTNTPSSLNYSRIICMLSPIENGNLNVFSSLYSGGNSQKKMDEINTITPKKDIKNTFFTYYHSQGENYAGLHNYINLYPADSVFQSEKWAVALIMPKDDLTKKISGMNLQIFILLLFLMIISIVFSIYISKHYIKPIILALNFMKSEKSSSLPRTNIPEIDDLFDFLSKQDESVATKENSSQLIGPPQNFTKFENFVKNIDTLSKGERSVFDLYMKGHTATEIADILYLSINTIKTHNKRIYSKLEVSSRKELLVYVHMMEEIL